MSLEVLLVLFLAGLMIGFASGLVGIGGGILIVPLLYFFYAHPAWSGVSLLPELHTEVAHATSLFIVIPTALWGARAYHKAGLVVWSAAVRIALASALAGVVGVQLALVLPAEIVRLVFGLFLLVTGGQLLWRPKADDGTHVHLTLPAVITIGTAVGLLSGLLGIGGGAIASALLISWAGFGLRRATATSLAIIAMTAVVSVAAYIITGLKQTDMPAGMLGYIHWAAALPILVGSVLTVKLGAQANQRLPSKSLKYVFSAFFTVLGFYLIALSVRAG